MIDRFNYILNKGCKLSIVNFSIFSKRTGLLVLIQLFYGIYLESVGQPNLKIIGWIFSSEVNTYLLTHESTVSITLSVFVFVIFFKMEGKQRGIEIKDQNNRFCKMIYKNFIDIQDWSHEKKASYRISLMTITEKWTINRQHNRWYTLNIGRDTHLEVVGRYLITEGDMVSSLYLTPSQGAAGFSFHNRIVHEIVMENFDSNSEEYYRKCESMGMNKKQVDTLNRKSAYYFCVPVPHDDREGLFGVVSIDSSLPESLPDNLKQEIEQYISTLKYLFTSNSRLWKN